MVSQQLAVSVCWLCLLLVGLVGVALLARKLALPTPVFLVLGGLGWGLLRHALPSLPELHVPPRLAFVGFVPPVLVSTAFNTPIGHVQTNRVAIGGLAIGLVLVTTAGVALVAGWMLSGLGLAAACMLGAIVAPPDPLAATAVGRRLGLPTWMSTVLEGEGMVNDASSLTLYHLALIAAVTGSLTAFQAARMFVQASLVGVGVGLLVSWAFTRVLEKIDDAVLEVVLTLVMPYAAFVLAELFGGSGVLSAVAAGFLLRSRSVHVNTARTRLSSRAVWQMLVFVINGLVFLIIGFDIGDLVARGIPSRLVWTSLAVTGTVIALRLAWLFGMPRLLRLVSRKYRRRTDRPKARELAILGWSGMRGVVSLVAALSVPTLVNGKPFAAREPIVVITFGVIALTLIVQGLSLPAIIHAFGVSRRDADVKEADKVRREAAERALARLDELGHELPREVVDDLRGGYQKRLDPERADQEQSAAYWRARKEALAAEREVVDDAWNDGRIGEEQVELLEREIDVQEVELGDDPEARQSEAPCNRPRH